MGEFNSDDHYIYYCRQESLRKNGVAIMVNKSLICSTWMESQKWQNDLCSFPRQTIQYHSNPSLRPNHLCQRSYKDLQGLLELTRTKDVLFIMEDWNAKVESQEIPGVTGKFGLGVQNEAGQKLIRVLPRECTGHSKHPLPTTQEMTLHMTSPNGQYWNQIDYILCSQRWRSSIQSAKTRPGADCGSHHELLTAKFRLKF